jgi:hypothetical protein
VAENQDERRLVAQKSQRDFITQPGVGAEPTPGYHPKNPIIPEGDKSLFLFFNFSLPSERPQ